MAFKSCSYDYMFFGAEFHQGENLRPTAAFFISDRSIRYMDIAMATPHNSIDPAFACVSVQTRKRREAVVSREPVPKLPSILPSPNGIPVSSQPPHGPVWLWNTAERTCGGEVSPPSLAAA